MERPEQIACAYAPERDWFSFSCAIAGIERLPGGTPNRDLSDGNILYMLFKYTPEHPARARYTPGHAPIPPAINLDDGWTVEYFEQNPEPHELASVGQFVPSLRRFVPGRRYGAGWDGMADANVRRRCWTCLRFDLHISAAPGTIMLYLNGRRMGEVDGLTVAVFDVTDFITLEDNQIALRVDCASEGVFGVVSVKAEPQCMISAGIRRHKR